MGSYHRLRRPIERASNLKSRSDDRVIADPLNPMDCPTDWVKSPTPNKAQLSGEAAKPAICIISHNAYGAISGGKSGFIGGVERQTSLLAKWLASRGHSVSLVTWEEGGPEDEEIDGVRVIKVCRKESGMPGFRFFHPKWSGLNTALRRAEADVFFHNCGECVTGQIALWCRRNNKPFVFSAASDGDCEYPHRGLLTRREQILFHYGITRANVRIVQTQRQKEMFKSRFGLDSIQIPMPCEEESSLPPARRSEPSNRVLWVGRIWMEKRPQWFLDLAESCPHLEFDLVGPGFCAAEYGHSFSDDIFRRAERIPNVTVHGALTREQIIPMYDAAACLCCTSEFEGFPNTFLEAWSRGLPVVSTFDPDDIIATRQLGAFAGTPGELKGAVEALFNDLPEYKILCRNARQHFKEYHTVEAVLPRFARALTGSAKLSSL